MVVFMSEPPLRIAVVSPSFASPGVFTELHEQALRRMRELGWEPVEYPTTRQVGASPQARAGDLVEALSDTSIDAVFAAIGGTDQITVISCITPAEWEAIVRRRPLFFGYSDNTNLINELYKRAVPAIYGGSTQVQMAPGSGIDSLHLASLQAALHGVDYQLQRPGWYADFGVDWTLPEALTHNPEHLPAPEWIFRGDAAPVTAPTFGGCLEVLSQIAIADRLPETIEDHILLLEACEDCTPPTRQRDVLRALGERGYLEGIRGAIVALPPQSNLQGGSVCLEEFNDIVDSTLSTYCGDLPRAFNIPCGHTLPQQVLPIGKPVTLDVGECSIIAHFGR